MGASYNHYGKSLPPGCTRAAHYNEHVCGAAGLYISLNQCSLSTGLVHRPVSVIISRQMNPTPGCPRPPEPPVQDAGPVAFADTFFLAGGPTHLLGCGFYAPINAPPVILRCWIPY